MASIRNRNGRWQVRIVRKGFPDQNRTFHVKADAERWARQIEREQDMGIFINRTRAENTTLGDVLKRYATEVTPLKRSHESELHRINKMQRDVLAKLAISNLHPQDIAAYRDRRILTIKASTANRELQLLSSILSHAKREWGIGIHENPVSQIRLPPVGNGRTRLFVGDEEERLMKTIRENLGYQRIPRKNPNYWLLPIVQLALETACRRGELLSLEWGNIDLDKAVAYLPLTKNGHPRFVPLSSKAKAIIESLPRQEGGRLFPIAWTALHQAFSKACRRAGLGDFHFHDLRHVATTRLAKRLPNVIELAAVTGHKSLSMLNRYYHTRAEELAKKLG